MDIFLMTERMQTPEQKWTKYAHKIAFPGINTGNATVFKKISYLVFQHLLKPDMSSAMKMVKSPFTILKQNAFYNIHDQMDRDLLDEGINRLVVASNYNGNAVNFGNGLDALVGITTSLRKIESAKIGTFIRIAKQRLISGNEKVVLCVNYTATVEDIAEGLKEYSPLVMTGKTNTIERGKIIASFAEDNDKYRLLIANVKVCSSGIDLDDKFGGRPRFCLVSPNYSSIDLYQLSHRFMRMNTKSNATIHMLYALHNSEIDILTALAQKSNVMKETTEEQVAAGVVFLGDYGEFKEV
jgi:hypothetical protein